MWRASARPLSTGTRGRRSPQPSPRARPQSLLVHTAFRAIYFALCLELVFTLSWKALTLRDRLAASTEEQPPRPPLPRRRGGLPSLRLGAGAGGLVVQNVTVSVTAVTDLFPGMAMKPLVTEASLEKAVSENDSRRPLPGLREQLLETSPRTTRERGRSCARGCAPVCVPVHLCVRCVSWGRGDVGPQGPGPHLPLVDASETHSSVDRRRGACWEALEPLALPSL